MSREIESYTTPTDAGFAAVVWQRGRAPEVIAVVPDQHRAQALADVEAASRMRHTEVAQRRRYVAALVAALVLLALALTLAARPAAAAPAAPACSEVQSVTPVLDGQYFAVTCPEGSIRVTARAKQPAPALGPASVRKTTSRRTGITTYSLLAGGERYAITR